MNKKHFAGISTERFIEAMNAEGIPNQASYPPLHKLHMFRNGKYRKRLSGKQAKEKHAFLKNKFPVTHKAAWETVWIPQPALLGDEEDMHEIAAALGKIQRARKNSPEGTGKFPDHARAILIPGLEKCVQVVQRHCRVGHNRRRRSADSFLWLSQRREPVP